jgi:hypothetical protein
MPLLQQRTRHPIAGVAGRYCPVWADLWLGRHRYRQGRYDTLTLACLRRAWHRHPCLRTLLAYLGCRRACGRPQPAPLLAALDRRLPEARGRDLHVALNLLLEGGTAHAPPATLDTATLRAAAAHSPPLAEELRQSGSTLDDKTRVLADLQARQPAWRQAFADWLATVRGSICVVGNAGTLVQSGLGTEIDAHRAVVRFNRYRSPNTRRTDTGARIDIWVCSPDLAGRELPVHHPAGWLVLSGCDVRYQLYHWERLLPLLASGGRVLTVPSTIWRDLIRQLGSPPSAGILLLAWLIDLQGDAKGITVAGFQSGRHPAQASRQYHHGLPWQTAGRRHNWPGERDLLQQWQTRGLAVLESS